MLAMYPGQVLLVSRPMIHGVVVVAAMHESGVIVHEIFLILF